MTSQVFSIFNDTIDISGDLSGTVLLQPISILFLFCVFLHCYRNSFCSHVFFTLTTVDFQGNANRVSFVFDATTPANSGSFIVGGDLDLTYLAVVVIENPTGACISLFFSASHPSVGVFTYDFITAGTITASPGISLPTVSGYCIESFSTDVSSTTVTMSIELRATGACTAPSPNPSPPTPSPQPDTTNTTTTNPSTTDNGVYNVVPCVAVLLAVMASGWF